MRKHTRRKVWSLVDPIAHAMAGACITDTTSLNKLRMRELAAIESFRIGRATPDDWHALADMLNIMETMCDQGIGPEALEACKDAQDALKRAHERHMATGRLGLTGPALENLREAFRFHDVQRTAIPRSDYERAIKRTADKIKSNHPSVTVCH